MNPEREILNFWYNRQGYLTLNNIKAGQNRELYMVAVKLQGGKAVEALQVEAQISVSASSGLIPDRGSVENEVAKFVKKKFHEKWVMDVMKKQLDQYGLTEYKKVFVYGAMPSNRKKKMIELFKEQGVEALDFSEVLADAVRELDGQAYQNHTVRTLQLFKFLIISEPVYAARALTEQMTSNLRERFLKEMLTNAKHMKMVAKNDDLLIEAIKHSSILNPARLAEMLSSNLSKKSYNLLMKELYAKHPVPTRRKKKDKSLASFLR